MIHIFLISLIIAPQLWLPPFIGVPVDYLIYPVWLVAAVVSGNFSRVPWNPFDTAFVLFIAMMTLGAIANSEFGIQTGYLINYTKWYVLCRLTISSIGSFENFNRVVTTLTTLVVILTVEVIHQKYFSDGSGWANQGLAWVDASVLEAGGSGRARWVGIFDGPGVFSVLFAMVMPFVLMRIHKPFSFGVRLCSLVFLAMMLIAVYLIGSRGGLLACMVIFALHIALRQKGGILRLKKWFFLIVPVCLVLLIVAPDHLTDLNDDSHSAAKRVDMWAEGIEMAEQNPVFGIGIGNFSAYTGSLIAHNSAVELMGELGVIGFALWVSLICLSFRSVILAASAETDYLDLLRLRALGLALVGYLVSAMFVTLEYETFYFLMALCVGAGYIKNVPVEFTPNMVKIILSLLLFWYVALKSFVIVYVIVING